MMNKKKKKVERKHNSVRGMTLWPIFMGQEPKKSYFLVHFS